MEHDASLAHQTLDPRAHDVNQNNLLVIWNKREWDCNQIP